MKRIADNYSKPLVTDLVDQRRLKPKLEVEGG
jgi:hypothetical protein